MKFSVIIPVYNVATELRRALDSLLMQSFSDWESVCVDDGSTDGSGTICDEYAAKDGRFRVVHQANAGVSAAREVGLKMARGEWVTWLDGDDWVESNFLELFADASARGDCDLLWMDYFIDSRNGCARRSQSTSPDIKEHVRALMEERIWGTLWCRAFRREFLTHNHIVFDRQSITFQEDLCFVAQCLRHKPRLAYIKECAYHYCQREGSALHGGVGSNIEGLIALQNSLDENLKGLGVDDLLLKRRKWTCLAMCRHAREVGLWRIARTFPDVQNIDDLPVSYFVRFAYWVLMRLLAVRRKARIIDPFHAA